MLMLLLTLPFLSPLLWGQAITEPWWVEAVAAAAEWPGLHQAFSVSPLALWGCPGMTQSWPEGHAAPSVVQLFTRPSSPVTLVCSLSPSLLGCVASSYVDQDMGVLESCGLSATSPT